MSIKGIVVIILYLIVAFVVLWWIFSSKSVTDKQAAVAVALSISGFFGALLFEPIRNKLESWIKNLFMKKSIYIILLFGRAGSGKTTFIETAFLINYNTNTISTRDFSYYQFKVSLQLNNHFTKTEVAVADYRGQNPSQIILETPPELFSAEGSPLINAILFIVDLVPRKSDKGNLFDDEALLQWLKDGGILHKIEDRVQEHYDYINEGMLELIFSRFYSDNLKSVMFLINKLDLIDKLIEQGDLDISKFKDSREYAKHHFERMIRNISLACHKLNIENFSQDYLVFTVSAKSATDLQSLITRLLRGRS